MKSFIARIYSLAWLFLAIFLFILRASGVPGAQAAGGYALSFNGSNQYVTFGPTSGLGAGVFTLETWFNWTGGGAAIGTGNGGLTAALPLLTKGRGEEDGTNKDMNYFLGIQGGKLAADFEEGPGGPGPLGQNHPVVGNTRVTPNTWHHAAVTYDGQTWRLYLDGQLDTSLTYPSPIPPRSDSIQHAALGSALNSTGVPASFFQGTLDEARVWGIVRTAAEIQGDMTREMTATPGLQARWGMNEDAGNLVADSSGHAINGTAIGNPDWVTGAPLQMVTNEPPDAPILLAPTGGTADVPSSPTLRVSVSDPDKDPLTVTFDGRRVAAPDDPVLPPGADFTVVVLPDVQYYDRGTDANPATFRAQTQWIVDQRASQNIPFVCQVGDITDDGDKFEYEWQNATSATKILDAGSIPYALAVGNHDQTPRGDANGTTTFYNKYFGESHFAGRSYYGGHYGSNNDDHYELFDASGLDFILINLEFNASSDPGVVAWTDGLLKQYSDRRAILVTHNVVDVGGPAPFSDQGQILYDALKGNPNLFLMLGGHNPGEGRREDTFNGNTIYSLLADYQNRPNGGDGWLRLLRFSPAHNQIHVETYSPTLEQFETDADSDFTLSYDMQSRRPIELGSVANITSGAQVEQEWPNLDPGAEYEWFVTVSDGQHITASPTWRFSTVKPTSTPTELPSPTLGDTPPSTPTVEATQTTATESPTTTGTPTEAELPTDTPTPTATELSTDTPTPTATEFPADTPTLTAIELLTDTPTPTATEFPSATPTSTFTEFPTATDWPTATETLVPTLAPSVTPTLEPSPTAMSTPVPTSTPTSTPTLVPSATPTFTPTETATAFPSPTPTFTPTTKPPTITPVPTVTTVELAPIADTYIDAAFPNTPFGTSTTLYVNGSPTQKTFFKFDLSSLAGKTIRSVVLQVTTTNSNQAGSLSKQSVHYVSDVGWTETFLTYNNTVLPKSISSAVIGSVSNTGPNTAYQIKLDSVTVQKQAGSKLSIVVEGPGKDNLILYSREYSTVSYRPELIITY